ncbi:DUF5985 family protein [Ramlibacter sp. MMS24-I3-19]|uniref:DUF5985 family protein n=1 Tax=Ramlibacter sp. MMS24-I3-19 TaxID=3416606 RepID=UPI003D03B5E6
MATLIYSLCALTSLACVVLLWRAQRRSRSRLLFWTAWCFLLLTVNNVLLVLDKVVFPVEVDLRFWRLSTGLVAVALLLYGLVMEEN